MYRPCVGPRTINTVHMIKVTVRRRFFDPALNVTRKASLMCCMSKKSWMRSAIPNSGPAFVNLRLCGCLAADSSTKITPYAKHITNNASDTANTPEIPTTGINTPDSAVAIGVPSDMTAFTKPILNVLVLTCVTKMT